MTSTPRFVPYTAAHRAVCLALFDANCPEFFAPNERADYATFVDRAGATYRVCTVDDQVAGAFGVTAAEAAERRRLSWIMLAPAAQGAGIGRAMLTEAIATARRAGASTLDIAASHRSASFFARFGARELRRIENGWGPNMHRIDMELPLQVTARRWPPGFTAS